MTHRQSVAPKTTLPPPQQQRHNRNHPLHLASIALNNMAVTLLERAAYMEALDTMKDSINLMKEFCQSRQSQQQQSKEGHSTADTDINVLLVQATHRCLYTSPSNVHNSIYFSPSGHESTTTSSTTGTPAVSCRNIQDYLQEWCDCSPITTASSTLYPEPCTSQPTPKASTARWTAPTTLSTPTTSFGHDIIFPIRIDECLCGFGEPDFESAILLHNFALVYYSLGRHHHYYHYSYRHHVTDDTSHNDDYDRYDSHPQYGDTHCSMAIQLWDTAQTVLTRFYYCSCHKHMQPTACLVSIAILHSLIPLLHGNVGNDNDVHRQAAARTNQTRVHAPPPPPPPASSSPVVVEVAAAAATTASEIAALTKTMTWCCSMVVNQYQRMRCTAPFASAA